MIKVMKSILTIKKINKLKKLIYLVFFKKNDLFILLNQKNNV
jgi:hypothetical protein